MCVCECESVVCKKRRRSGKDFLKGVVRQVLTCLSQHWLPSVTVARLCWHRPFSVSFTLTFRLTNRHTLLFYYVLLFFIYTVQLFLFSSECLCILWCFMLFQAFPSGKYNIGPDERFFSCFSSGILLRHR